MATTPHLGLILLEQAQAQKEVTVNSALMRIDALLNATIKDKDLATPPVSPLEGDVYIVAAGATGAWAGKESQIAYFEQVWRFIAPSEGLLLWLADEGQYYIFDGTDWNLSPLGASALGDLSDVNLSSPSNGQVLTYHSGTSKWTNQNIPAAYNDEAAQDAVGTILTDTATIDFTYNDGANTITADVKDASLGTAKLGGDITSAGKALLDDASASAQRTTLGLVIGTDVQAYHARLQDIATNLSATSGGIEKTGANSFAAYTLTAAGKALIDDADAAAQRTTLGLGTAATQNTGTSGATVPLLNTAVRFGSSGLGTDGSFYTGARTTTTVLVNEQGFALSSSGFAVSSRNGTGTQSHFIIVNDAASAAQQVGSITSNGTASSYNTTSDGRLKEDAQPIANSGEVVDALNPVYHGWKGYAHRSYGFIAQELYAVFPDAVAKGDDDFDKAPGDAGFEAWQMDASKLVPLMVAELQALRRRLAALEQARE